MDRPASWRLQNGNNNNNDNNNNNNNKDSSTTTAEQVIKSSCPAEDNVRKIRPFQVVNDALQKEGGAAYNRSFYVYIPPKLCSTLISTFGITLSPNKKYDTPLRIILAIHGYGGRPMQEINKWHDVAIELQSIIIASQGLPTASDHRLGWNAVDCCGDPVINKIDDMDFIMNGVVEMLLDIIFGKQRGDDSSTNGDIQRANVISTGFSNGGFMSSLLGLVSGDIRPAWLAGIVPTGGYQYGADLYNGPSKPHPLPMMSHHGGRDSIVKPDGCCATSAATDNSETSNCQMEIGINQKTCTSVQSAFEMWSHINGCSSTALDEDVVGNNESRRMKNLGKDHQEPIYTCWKGENCKEPTNFCLWHNEGHDWGFKLPGIGMTQTWMAEIFERAETRGSVDIIEEDVVIITAQYDDDEFSMSYASAISFYDHHSKKGKLIFSATVVILMVTMLCVISTEGENLKVK